MKIIDYILGWFRVNDNKRFNDGYNWAAGSLLRGELTVEQVEGYIYQVDHPFDKGASAALEKLRADTGVTVETDDNRTNRQKLYDYLRNKIDNEGLTQISGARFVDTNRLEDGKQRVVKANTTLEDYVDNMQEELVDEFLGMYGAIDDRKTMPIRFNDGAASIPLYAFDCSIPDIEALKRECVEHEGLLSAYQVGLIFEYIDILEKSCVHWHSKICVNKQVNPTEE